MSAAGKGAKWIAEALARSSRSAGSAAKTATEVGTKSVRGKIATKTSRLAKGFASVVVADYALDIAIDEAAHYSDFVDRNKDAIKGITVALGLVHFAGGRRLTERAINRLKNRWTSAGFKPTLFPKGRFSVPPRLLGATLGTLMLSRSAIKGGVEFAISRGKEPLLTLTRIGKRVNVKNINPKYAAIAAAALGGGALFLEELTDDDIDDVLTTFEMLLAQAHHEDEIGALSDFYKQFSVLELWGEPRSIAESALLRWPDLEYETVFSVMSHVRDTIEEEAGNDWFEVGNLDGVPTVSFNGFHLRRKDGFIIPVMGGNNLDRVETWDDEHWMLLEVGRSLADMLRTVESDGSIYLDPVDVNGNYRSLPYSNDEEKRKVSAYIGFAKTGSVYLGIMNALETEGWVDEHNKHVAEAVAHEGVHGIVLSASRILGLLRHE